MVKFAKAIEQVARLPKEDAIDDCSSNHNFIIQASKKQIADFCAASGALKAEGQEFEMQKLAWLEQDIERQ